MSKLLTLEDIKKRVDSELKLYKPESETVVMRYMEFPKFVSILESKSLFLTRADKFEDLLEGYVFEWYINRMIVGSKIFGEEWTENQKTNLIKKAADLKTRTFISCWNEAQNESYALWQIYAKKYGVAIKTSVKKLEGIISNLPADVYKIRYIDKNEHVIFPNINENPFSLDNLFVCKQKHYLYENEIRIILTSVDNKISPIPINNLFSFIEEVFVSPFAEDWFLELVKTMVNKTYKLDIPVNKSQIKINI
jgi:hypothetical protein